jgi:hypothetical protein
METFHVKWRRSLQASTQQQPRAFYKLSVSLLWSLTLLFFAPLISVTCLKSKMKDKCYGKWQRIMLFSYQTPQKKSAAKHKGMNHFQPTREEKHRAWRNSQFEMLENHPSGRILLHLFLKLFVLFKLLYFGFLKNYSMNKKVLQSY